MTLSLVCPVFVALAQKLETLHALTNCLKPYWLSKTANWNLLNNPFFSVNFFFISLYDPHRIILAKNLYQEASIEAEQER